jgi:RNA-directed DNA polymerase
MHYAFDMWMSRIFPGIPFERFADDVIVHCTSQAQAVRVLAAIDERIVEVGLRLHPDKTKIVDCRTRRQGKGEQPVSYIFLNYEFRKRPARNKKTGRVFTAFLPAVSKPAMKRMSDEVRGWRLHNKTTLTLPELARWLNPIIGGWVQYFGKYYQTELNPLLRRINTYLVRWLRKKYKRLKSLKKAKQAWLRIIRQFPRGFIHWERVTSF